MTLEYRLNTQTNADVERIHQSTFKMYLEYENPWEGTLSSTMFPIQSTMHTTAHHILLQLMYGRDSVLNINQEVNWL